MHEGERERHSGTVSRGRWEHQLLDPFEVFSGGSFESHRSPSGFHFLHSNVFWLLFTCVLVCMIQSS